jgi:hypothetical protein
MNHLSFSFTDFLDINIYFNLYIYWILFFNVFLYIYFISLYIILSSQPKKLIFWLTETQPRFIFVGGGGGVRAEFPP